MRGDRFVPRLIQFVLVLGVLSAVLTVGEDVLDETGESSIASSDGGGASDGPLPDATTIVPPQNASRPEENRTTEAREAPALPCATAACDGLLA